MPVFRIILIFVFTVFFAACAVIFQEKKEVKEHVVPIIPKPERIIIEKGKFVLSPSTKIYLETENEQVKIALKFWKELIYKGWGSAVLVVTNIDAKTEPFIQVKLNDELPSEGYQLIISKERILIEAADGAGVFYAFQTLRQLLPPEFEKGHFSKQQIEIPCLKISDKPRFVWRGMMLDVSRHFFDKTFVKQFIDYLAMHKMNRFHWHLGDDQGWRLEIKKYPKLTEIGAWRVDREDKPWNAREEQKPGEKATYGGYYTQEDIREIVQYARERFITIVPEIEMPGHTRAVLAAYPQFSCTGGPFTVMPGGYWPIKDIFCAGKDSTFQFLQDILDEVMELFPGDYIHIGGDEADKTNWRNCPDCQRRMKEEGLQTEEELQSYFIKRMEKYINSKGKKLIGWDEILEGGLAPRATVMSWRGYEGGVEAARSGHDVVMTPTSFCYFDYYQGDRDLEPETIGGYLPLSKVYQFEPVPDSLSAEEAKHVLGGQANLWTEYVPNPQHAQYMIFPRLAAMAEALWTFPENKDWLDFTWRLGQYLSRLDALELNYARSAFNVQIRTEIELKSKRFSVALQSELPFVQIRYRLDGKTPETKDALYTEPFEVNRSGEVTARTFWNGKPVGKVTHKKLWLHKATGKPVTLLYPYSPKYSGDGPYTLTNSLNGSLNYSDGQWLGFEGQDLDATIDLGKIRKVRNIEVGFLNDIGSWIFFPRQVIFSIAEHEGAFQKVKTVPNELPEDYAQRERKTFSVNFPEQNARYIRVQAKNLGVCPPWHMGAGGKAWIFVDEIVVE